MVGELLTVSSLNYNLDIKKMMLEPSERQRDRVTHLKKWEKQMSRKS